MKTTMKSLGIMALVSAAVTTTAAAEERGYAGTLCNTTATNVLYDQMGPYTTNLSSAVVHCGGAPLVGANVDRIQATVYDRNPSADLCCRMYVLNADGTAITSANRCSSGSGNPAQLLSAVMPANVVGTVDLECTIPAASPNGFSRVSSYRIRSTP